jgi:hypothetical protein
MRFDKLREALLLEPFQIEFEGACGINHSFFHLQEDGIMI